MYVWSDSLGKNIEIFVVFGGLLLEVIPVKEKEKLDWAKGVNCDAIERDKKLWRWNGFWRAWVFNFTLASCPERKVHNIGQATPFN